ncbi:MAG: hypothetical protein GY801_32125 [bacterium]|nr:hypothetical protein [bacterium]
MEAIHIQSTENTIQIVLDENVVNIDFLVELLEQLRLEHLAQKIDFAEDIIRIGDDIKKSWWQKNKDEFLKGIPA